jgi:hypothetical protein
MRDIKVRKASLHNSDDEGDLKDKSPQQLLGLMWELTLSSWSFKEKLDAEPRLQRHVIVLKRRGS